MDNQDKSVIGMGVCFLGLFIMCLICFTAWQLERVKPRCTDLEIRKLELEIEGKKLDIEIAKVKLNKGEIK